MMQLGEFIMNIYYDDKSLAIFDYIGQLFHPLVSLFANHFCCFLTYCLAQMTKVRLAINFVYIHICTVFNHGCSSSCAEAIYYKYAVQL